MWSDSIFTLINLIIDRGQFGCWPHERRAYVLGFYENVAAYVLGFYENVAAYGLVFYENVAGYVLDFYET